MKNHSGRFGLTLAVAQFFLFAAQMIFGQTQPVARQSQIIATTTSGDGSAILQLTVPADVALDSLTATLNCKDVTVRFTPSACTQGTCEKAVFAAPDGLHVNKNVLAVVAKRKDGTLISTRTRFAGSKASPVASNSADGLTVANANVASALPTLSAFLPLALAFNTLQDDGFTVGSPWIQIGSQLTFPYASFKCYNYAVIVFDRQTLQERQTQCFVTGPELKAFLATLDSSELVVVGSEAGGTSDAYLAPHQLDTSDIGGKAYNCVSQPDCSSLSTTTVTSQDVPLGYMAIGVGGAASGTAFENYYLANTPWVVGYQNAHGMLVEDANGNYNFQASGAVEYTVVPNDPNNSNVSTITVGSLPGDPYFVDGQTNKLYRPPVTPGQNGF